MAVARRAVDITVLIASVVAWAVAVYLLRGPFVRTVVSLLLLWPITLTYNRLSGIDVTLPGSRWVETKRFYKRRFLRMRERVDRLLDEIRRLNRLAVDAERGFRSREPTAKQIEAIEARMRELLAEIRESAGVEDELDAEASPSTPRGD